MEQRKVTVRFADSLMMGIDGLGDHERYSVLNRHLIKMGVLTDDELEALFEFEKNGSAALVLMVDEASVVKHYPDTFEIEVVHNALDPEFLALMANPPAPE